MDLKKLLPKVGTTLMVVGILITLYDILIRVEKKELFESFGMLIFAVGMIIIYFPKKENKTES